MLMEYKYNLLIKINHNNNNNNFSLLNFKIINRDRDKDKILIKLIHNNYKLLVGQCMNLMMKGNHYLYQNHLK